MKRRIVLIHASPAALPPLARYYAAEAPELDITNLLDDGLLRYFKADDWTSAQRRLAAMLDLGIREYGAELAMLTCSAVPLAVVNALRASAAIAVLKIDDHMAQLAVKQCARIGVVVSFPPTLPTTVNLLKAAAAAEHKTVVLETCVIPEALQALLHEDYARHDQLLVPAIHELAGRGVNGVVLAQVSMARVLPIVEPRLNVPVFNSLTSSLQAIRASLSQG